MVAEPGRLPSRTAVATGVLGDNDPEDSDESVAPAGQLIQAHVRLSEQVYGGPCQQESLPTPFAASW